MEPVKIVFVLMYMVTRVAGMSGVTYAEDHPAFDAKAEYGRLAGCQAALLAMNDEIDAFGHHFSGEGHCELIQVQPGNFISRDIKKAHETKH
jgi:hypothetical protein